MKIEAILDSDSSKYVLPKTVPMTVNFGDKTVGTAKLNKDETNNLVAEIKITDNKIVSLLTPSLDCYSISSTELKER